MRKRMVGIGAVLCACLLLQAQEHERVSLAIAHQIRNEAFGGNSRVMDTSFYLTDVHGPRLTGSPQARRAAEWAVQKLTEWGLVNAKMEPWGSSFGKGWECTRYVAMMKTPEFQPIIGFAAP
jgi:carboxypeptidase Q